MLFGNVAKIILIVLMTLFSTVICGKCFQCRSDQEKDCDVLKGHTFLKDCAKNTTAETNSTIDGIPPPYGLPQVCRKIQHTLKVKKSADLVTIRECAESHVGEECVKVANKLVYMLICDCKGHACNRSARTDFIPILLLLSLIAIFIKQS